MRKLLYALALTAALCGPAYAQDADDDEQGSPVRCYTPDEMQAQGAKSGLTLVADMHDEELDKFNAAYEARFHQDAPAFDRVLIYTTSDNPEHYWVLAFVDGCIVSKPVRIPVKLFKILHDGEAL